MITFIIQAETDKGRLLPIHDFSWTLIESIKYNTWFFKEEKYRYYLHPTNCPFHDCLKPGYIPVGSVEFVIKFLKQVAPGQVILPLSIPGELFDYEFTGRDMELIKGDTKETIAYVSKNRKLLSDSNEKVFAKSVDEIKGYTEFIKPCELPSSGTYLLSEIVDIKSEWRGFVYKGKLIDIRSYSGDVGAFPDMQQVNFMITAYQAAPPAYTIDVAVLKNGKTVIIECHNFFSCGLYGFADHSLLPTMLIKAFNWQIQGGDNRDFTCITNSSRRT